MPGTDYPPRSQSVLQIHPQAPSRASRILYKVTSLGGRLRLRLPSHASPVSPTDSFTPNVTRKDQHHPYPSQVRGGAGAGADLSIKPYMSHPMLSGLGVMDAEPFDPERDGYGYGSSLGGGEESSQSSPASGSDSRRKVVLGEQKRISREEVDEHERFPGPKTTTTAATSPPTRTNPIDGLPLVSHGQSHVYNNHLRTASDTAATAHRTTTVDPHVRTPRAEAPALTATTAVQRPTTSPSHAKSKSKPTQTRAGAHEITATAPPTTGPTSTKQGHRPMTPSIVISNPSQSHLPLHSSQIPISHTNPPPDPMCALPPQMKLPSQPPVSTTTTTTTPTSPKQKQKPKLEITRLFTRKPSRSRLRSDDDPPTPHPSSSKSGAQRPPSPPPPLPPLRPSTGYRSTVVGGSTPALNGTSNGSSTSTNTNTEPQGISRISSTPPRLTLPSLSHRFSLTLSDGSPSLSMRMPMVLPPKLPVPVPVTSTASSSSRSSAATSAGAGAPAGMERATTSGSGSGTRTPKQGHGQGRRRAATGLSTILSLPLSGPSAPLESAPSPELDDDEGEFEDGEEDGEFDEASSSMGRDFSISVISSDGSTSGSIYSGRGGSEQDDDGTSSYRPARPSFSSSILSFSGSSVSLAPSYEGELAGRRGSHSRSSSYNFEPLDGGSGSDGGSAPGSSAGYGSYPFIVPGTPPTPPHTQNTQYTRPFTPTYPALRPAYTTTNTATTITTTTARRTPTTPSPPALDLSFLTRPPKPTRALPVPQPPTPAREVNVRPGKGKARADSSFSGRIPGAWREDVEVVEEEEEARTSDLDVEEDEDEEEEYQDALEGEGGKTPVATSSNGSSHSPRHQVSGYFSPNANVNTYAVPGRTDSLRLDTNVPAANSNGKGNNGENNSNNNSKGKGKGKERVSDVQTPRARAPGPMKGSVSESLGLGMGLGVAMGGIGVPFNGFGANISNTLLAPAGKHTVIPSQAVPGEAQHVPPMRPSLYNSKRASRSMVDIYAAAKREQVERIVDEAVGAEEEERKNVWRRSRVIGGGFISGGEPNNVGGNEVDNASHGDGADGVNGVNGGHGDTSANNAGGIGREGSTVQWAGTIRAVAQWEGDTIRAKPRKEEVGQGPGDVRGEAKLGKGDGKLSIITAAMNDDKQQRAHHIHAHTNTMGKENDKDNNNYDDSEDKDLFDVDAHHMPLLPPLGAGPSSPIVISPGTAHPTTTTINTKRMSKAPAYETLAPSTHTPHPGGGLRRRRSMPTFNESTTDPPPYPAAFPHAPGTFIKILPRDDEGRERLPPYSNDIFRSAVIPRKMEFTAAGIQAKDRKWRRVFCVLEGTALKVYRAPAGAAGGGVLGEWWERKVGVGDVYAAVGSGSATAAAAAKKAERERERERPPKVGMMGEEEGAGHTEILVSTPITPVSPARAHPQLSGEHPYIPGQPPPVRTPTPSPQPTRSRLANLLRPGKHVRSGSDGAGMVPRERSPRPSLSGLRPSTPAGGLRPGTPASGLRPGTPSDGYYSQSSTGHGTPSVYSETSRPGTSASHYTGGEAETNRGERDLLRVYTMQNAESGLGNDYIKRKNVIRVRVEGEQFLLQAKDEQDVVGWIEVLQASANVALDLDERLMPKPPIFPRRRRRRNRRPATGGGGSQAPATTGSDAGGTAAEPPTTDS